MNDELIEIYRRYFGPGSGFEDEDPSSCTFFSLALSFEGRGKGRLAWRRSAEELLRLAAADETVCGLASCSHCDGDLLPCTVWEPFLPYSDELN